MFGIKFHCATGALLLLAQFALGSPPATHIYESKEGVSFADLQSGQRIADFLPKSSAFTSLLCNAVGDDGRVYVVKTPEQSDQEDRAAFYGCANAAAIPLLSRKFPAPELHSDSDDPGWVYPYFVSRLPIESFIAPEPLDVIWISERYGDLRTEKFGSPNMTWVNGALLNALKPGGELVAEEVSVDASRVKKDMSAVGFEFVTEHISGNLVLLKFRKPH